MVIRLTPQDAKRLRTSLALSILDARPQSVPLQDFLDLVRTSWGQSTRPSRADKGKGKEILAESDEDRLSAAPKRLSPPPSPRQPWDEPREGETDSQGRLRATFSLLRSGDDTSLHLGEILEASFTRLHGLFCSSVKIADPHDVDDVLEVLQLAFEIWSDVRTNDSPAKASESLTVVIDSLHRIRVLISISPNRDAPNTLHSLLVSTLTLLDSLNLPRFPTILQSLTASILRSLLSDLAKLLPPPAPAPVARILAHISLLDWAFALDLDVGSVDKVVSAVTEALAEVGVADRLGVAVEEALLWLLESGWRVDGAGPLVEDLPT